MVVVMAKSISTCDRNQGIIKNMQTKRLLLLSSNVLRPPFSFSARGTRLDNAVYPSLIPSRLVILRIAPERSLRWRCCRDSRLLSIAVGRPTGSSVTCCRWGSRMMRCTRRGIIRDRAGGTTTSLDSLAKNAWSARVLHSVVASRVLLARVVDVEDVEGVDMTWEVAEVEFSDS